MTGQVKEDVLSRFGELGVFIKEGKLCFNPCLLRKEEFVTRETSFKFISVVKEHKEIIIPKGSLGFTYCQVPITYHISEKDSLEISFRDGSHKQYDSLLIDSTISEKIFRRTGEVVHIKANINTENLK